MQTISVTVAGETSSGKSTVLAIIEEALISRGIKVEVKEGLATEMHATRRVARAKDPTFADRIAEKGTIVALDEIAQNRLVTERAGA